MAMRMARSESGTPRSRGTCDRGLAASAGARPTPRADEPPALRTISLDRRNSLTSRSSSASRCASPAVVPTRSSVSISAWLTHPRNVSGLIPQQVADPAHSTRTAHRTTPCVDRHPDRPLPKLLGVLPRRHHDSRPLGDREPATDPARDRQVWLARQVGCVRTARHSAGSRWRGRWPHRYG